MKKHPIWLDGEKLIREDVAAAATIAGTADDYVRGAIVKIPVEPANNAKGYVQPWRDGPLVTGNGATGQLAVSPFRMFRSATGALSNAGTELADEAAQTHEEVMSGYYPGGTVTVPTPPTASGTMRWDLLYAIASETDSDAAQRVVVPAGGVGSTKTIFTRHKSVVTLAWVRGSELPEGATPGPGALPTLPSPVPGTAHAVLAYVRVNQATSPSTVTYGPNQIYNDTRLALPNEHAGAAVSVTGLGVGAGGAPIAPNFAKLAAMAASDGGWGTSPSDTRPPAAVAPRFGGGMKFVQVSTGAAPFGTGNWSSPQLIATPDPSHPLSSRDATNWLQREFFGAAIVNAFAFGSDLTVGVRPRAPTTDTPYDTVSWGAGQSHQDNVDFKAQPGWPPNLRPCCYWAIETGGNALALAVDPATGALYLLGRSPSFVMFEFRSISLFFWYTPRAYPI